MRNFQEFLSALDETSRESKDFRHGQALMNVLYEFWPEKYHEITAGEHDCFYDDLKVGATLEKLEREWP